MKPDMPSLLPRLFILCSICLLSCKKDIPAPVLTGNQNPGNFSQVFDTFWNSMNLNYVYWDIDPTDWDSIYNRYKFLFSQLNLQAPDDIRKSVAYFREMTDGLVDSHYFIQFNRSQIADSTIYPAYDRKKKAWNFRAPYSFAYGAIKYLDSGYMAGYDSTVDPGHLLYALSGIINHKIIYFTCNEFALARSFGSGGSNGVKSVLRIFFNYLENPPSTVRGLIIDLRDNTGGNLDDLDFLAGRLIDNPLLIGYTRYRSGNGRLDYTPWIKAYIHPYSGAKAFKLPIIILADNFSASMAEIFTMSIRCLSNGTFVGETTWGATGPIIDNMTYNDGPFTIAGFMSVTTSSAELKYIDGNSYEGKGFPPDIPVPFNLITLLQGHDEQLEKAISLIP